MIKLTLSEQKSYFRPPYYRRRLAAKKDLKNKNLFKA